MSNPASSQPPDPAALSDERLAGRVQGGCVNSYEELDRRYRARLVHLLRRRVGREADAEDLAQATLWTAYSKIDSFDTRRKFSTWLFTIGLRKAIDHGRSVRRRPTVGGEATRGLAAADEGPLGRAIRREQSDAGAGVWQLADRVLKPNQWLALWLHYGEDQSTAEVARALSITTVNARVLLHRARKALAKAMESAASSEREPEPGTPPVAVAEMTHTAS
jgi:RNA polymerase sigma-70 factor (ECF subfamily)